MRRMGTALVLIILVGVFVGYSRWRSQLGENLEAAPIGDTLATEEIVSSLKNTVAENDKGEAQIHKSDWGQVEVRRWTEDGIVYYQLKAEVPALESGFYNAWIKNESAADLVNLGAFTEEKGGFLLSFQTKGEVIGYDRFMVTREYVDDARPEQVIVSGKLPSGQ